MKVIFRSSLIAFILSFPAVLVFYHSWQLVSWVNIIFYIGLIYLVVGSILLILSGHFFTAFIYSCKRFFRIASRKEQVIQEVEGRRIRTLPVRTSYPPSKPWIYAGLSFCMVSIVFSLGIVYFRQ
ncbi:uncharacterized protein DUF3899 [Scopulibacillus darangshiensis]|uniref:Uncharacterized protein DUF3899 n=1 Tax=Scopulibacillus darangshiensis TaxID=442528 RepID=A0A4R2P827_9BACL|nr:uncharacterized protein DUF3899 [Scopulibacillus darangshiensis]